MTDEVRQVVVGTVADVLAVDDRTVATTARLTDIPEFNSFRMAEIVERLESRFAAQLDPEQLVPANLSTVDGLCRLFTPFARAGSGGRQP